MRLWTSVLSRIIIVHLETTVLQAVLVLQAVSVDEWDLVVCNLLVIYGEIVEADERKL